MPASGSSNNTATCKRGKRGLFLSHQTTAKPFIRFLKKDLTDHHIDAWLDEHELQLADGLTDTIADAITARLHLAACFSGPASRWMRAEIDMAMACGATIVPLLIPGGAAADVPELLADRLYGDFRAASYYDSSFERLLAVLDPALGCKLELDAYRKDYLVLVSQTAGMAEWVIDYAIHRVGTCPDATQRYWAYQVLAAIGAPRACDAVARAVRLELDPFARRGAREALDNLQGHKYRDRSTEQNEKGG